MRREYRGQRKIGELAEVAVMPVAQRYGFAMFKILSNWPEIVGEFLAKHSTPKGLQFSGDQTVKGVLQIVVENPGFSLELQASERIIIQKIATFFGYQAVDRIRVEIARTRKPVKVEVPEIVPKQELSRLENEDVFSNISSVEDDNLREILTSIAQQSFTTSEE